MQHDTALVMHVLAAGCWGRVSQIEKIELQHKEYVVLHDTRMLHIILHEFVRRAHTLHRTVDKLTYLPISFCRYYSSISGSNTGVHHVTNHFVRMCSRSSTTASIK